MRIDDMQKPPVDTEIAAKLRQIGTVEGYDTILQYGGREFVVHDDGAVYVIDAPGSISRLVSTKRVDAGKKRKPYRNRSKYDEHLISDHNLDPGGDDSPDCGPSD